jgi:ABC-type polysaccharide/polyol phosphate transport system ATPase subunit
MALIELDNLGLTFTVRKGGPTSFKDWLLRRKSPRLDRLVEVRALSGVNFAARDGERIGILGRNGAGKSSLLRVLAGIYPPTTGHRRVVGRISSLFDLCLGFEPEATGWENIRYRGYLQGETPRTIEAKLSAIAEFCELGDFLDMPVRCYSDGMKVRLAFAIATAVEPEILIVDEVLSVGDMAFQIKARQRMRDMMARARLIVMVSHDLGSLAELCPRGIWLDQGRVRQDGTMHEVIAAYTASAQDQVKQAA